MISDCMITRWSLWLYLLPKGDEREIISTLACRFLFVLRLCAGFAVGSPKWRPCAVALLLWPSALRRHIPLQSAQGRTTPTQVSVGKCRRLEAKLREAWQVRDGRPVHILLVIIIIIFFFLNIFCRATTITTLIILSLLGVCIAKEKGGKKKT